MNKFFRVLKKQRLSLFFFLMIMLMIAGNLLLAARSKIPGAEQAARRQDRDRADAAQPLVPTGEVTSHRIAAGSSTYGALVGAGLERQDALTAIDAAAAVEDMSRIPAGLAFDLHWTDTSLSTPTAVIFHHSPIRKLVLAKDVNTKTWLASVNELPVEKKTVTFTGVVATNLWESANASGMDTKLIGELTNIFAWQIDFNREVQRADQWRLVVEREYAAGQPIGWGNILAAEYDRSGETYTAIRYPQTAAAADASYYMPDGSSLRRIFLKSPIKFGRVSSRFRNQRFHPVLQRNMPHNGVDYAAPPGTPVMSVGNGTVELAGRRGGSGIMVRIRHNSTYQTAYLHLQGIAKGVHIGSKIKQGEVIGYVGSTGLANGPHVHFAFYEHGKFVDPLGRKFPAKDPVPTAAMPDFKNITAEILQLLPRWKLAGSKDGEGNLNI